MTAGAPHAARIGKTPTPSRGTEVGSGMEIP
jgi:hypothetical protein